jgi:hypothetical protein
MSDSRIAISLRSVKSGNGKHGAHIERNGFEEGRDRSVLYKERAAELPSWCRRRVKSQLRIEKSRVNTMNVEGTDQYYTKRRRRSFLLGTGVGSRVSVVLLSKYVGGKEIALMDDEQNKG